MKNSIYKEKPLTILSKKTSKSIVEESDEQYIRLNEYFNKRVKNFRLDERITNNNAYKKLVYYLKRNMIDEAIEVKNSFDIDDEYIRSDFLTKIIKKNIIRCLNELRIDDIVKIKNNFYVPNSFIKSNEVQYKAKKKIIYCLKNGYIDEITRIVNNFDISEHYIESYEVKKIAQSCIKKFLKKHQIDVVIKIQELFNIRNDNINNIIREIVVQLASAGFVDLAISIKERVLRNIKYF